MPFGDEKFYCYLLTFYCLLIKPKFCVVRVDEGLDKKLSSMGVPIAIGRNNDVHEHKHLYSLSAY
jgi:hypothetical protein